MRKNILTIVVSSLLCYASCAWCGLEVPYLGVENFGEAQRAFHLGIARGARQADNFDEARRGVIPGADIDLARVQRILRLIEDRNNHIRNLLFHNHINVMPDRNAENPCEAQEAMLPGGGFVAAARRNIPGGEWIILQPRNVDEERREVEFLLDQIARIAQGAMEQPEPERDLTDARDVANRIRIARNAGDFDGAQRVFDWAIEPGRNLIDGDGVTAFILAAREAGKDGEARRAIGWGMDRNLINLNDFI